MFPKIREVHIRNYKSIAQAVVPLADFTLLVGPNGSGKSNFVGALSFVQQCLSESIRFALASRGGVPGVRRQQADPSEPIGFRFVIDLGVEKVADYAFELSGSLDSGITVSKERCVIRREDGTTNTFAVEEGEFQQEIAGIRPRVEPDRLTLYAASAVEEFRDVYDALTAIRSYQINPERVSRLQPVDQGFLLQHDGGNAASVLKHIQESDPELARRISRLLTRVVTGLRGVSVFDMKNWYSLIFHEKDVLHIGSNMSDGTLRLLGMMLAAYQSSTASILIIEEPEVAIHPAAAEVVMAVLLDAAKRCQVLVTTHSPDILDHKSLDDESVRMVVKEDENTMIAPISAASRQAIRERLYSPGELLRSNELNADVEAAAELSRRSDLCGPPARTLGEAA